MNCYVRAFLNIYIKKYVFVPFQTGLQFPFSSLLVGGNNFLTFFLDQFLHGFRDSLLDSLDFVTNAIVLVASSTAAGGDVVPESVSTSSSTHPTGSIVDKWLYLKKNLTIYACKML